MAAIQTSLLRDVDGKETKVNVEKAFADYGMYMITVPDDIMPKVTPSYSLVPPSNTNAFHSSTEDTAIKRVDYEIKRDNFMQKVQRSVNRLSKRERELIIKTYMTYEDVYAFDVYNEWESVKQPIIGYVSKRSISLLLPYNFKYIKKLGHLPKEVFSLVKIFYIYREKV